MTYSTTIGKFELTSLQVWPLQQIPITEVLVGTNTKNLEQAYNRQPQYFGTDETLVELTQNICVIRSSEQIILVDTGDSLKRAGTILQWGLASLGIKLEQVNFVFLTHRDDDHIGGTVNLRADAC
jgi:glyoxylase-like metal-dependent hydrolase (beta-lactamase superfamily II)